MTMLSNPVADGPSRVEFVDDHAIHRMKRVRRMAISFFVGLAVLIGLVPIVGSPPYNTGAYVVYGVPVFGLLAYACYYLTMRIRHAPRLQLERDGESVRCMVTIVHWPKPIAKVVKSEFTARSLILARVIQGDPARRLESSDIARERYCPGDKEQYCALVIGESGEFFSVGARKKLADAILLVESFELQVSFWNIPRIDLSNEVLVLAN
jgi:hypothetical protein